ncbi:Na+/H+ antiporter subunit E [Lederbergia galactosidilytica]|uniref:Monovalent cation/H+ antiporter subunit E n=1 Tax=Lederbergia galactosidilytica TaxID=217031 RepID=A0A0Q9Y7U8_9BACI|nr:Na+/H+ antiporter subunit E [Lederbergia galactosidilytica]KRG14856.1 monovalent cation/H+ antiporter subunit E [Virgibacillus soli]KRG16939.1 monovalent cation/H+ antiporter subunit E [Lederbergia galactosidilytica]MBP1914532.1 multicomponent Na+:H+ antiporter subunit E [Lederbergia galactosidilytica]OAK69105.1 monovalent cation/H+ antiporter subunit E [Lederbergia galactosidilytica]
MPAQFIMNLFIAFLWMLLTDEDEFRLSTFFAGYLVGIVIVFLMQRFFKKQFYLQRFYYVIKLIFIFNSELFQSAFLVMKHILSPKIDIQPGIFTYKTGLKSDWEVTTLSMLLTLTPGSVVMEISPEGDTLYIHALDIERYKDFLLRSLEKFEKAIMEVTR